MEQKVQEYGEQKRQMKAAIKRVGNRTKELDNLLQLDHFYIEGKPVYDKLNTIKSKKAREEFAAENEGAPHFFYLVQRQLKPHFRRTAGYPSTPGKGRRGLFVIPGRN